MGRLIDEDILIDSIPDLSVFEQEDFGTPDMIRLIEDAPTAQAIPKADYETRLKTDLVAILTELQLEIEEKASVEGDWIFAEGERFCGKLIQQKINALKTDRSEEDGAST